MESALTQRQSNVFEDHQTWHHICEYEGDNKPRITHCHPDKYKKTKTLPENPTIKSKFSKEKAQYK